ncbi:hypothetical protein EVAR_33570_1 [Eumeta japonica]|uniref:Uncharacterized protein n=1 Tax=Eumeta variegata TaxID=151549 RepID=A0A4C1VJP8_EUMVA|nr:hypothetical protein EVAR_33570_1 [Eumeta japonica]
MHLSLQNQLKKKQCNRAVVRCADAEPSVRGMLVDFGKGESIFEPRETRNRTPLAAIDADLGATTELFVEGYMGTQVMLHLQRSSNQTPGSIAN